MATNEEIVALKKAGCTEKIHCCGRGAIDVPETTYDDIIINVGIGRSLGYEIGTVVNPSGCFDIGQDQYFSLYHDSSFGYTLCLTTDFEVEENFCNNYPSNTIYDHELGKLLSLPHKEIKCLNTYKKLNKGV